MNKKYPNLILPVMASAVALLFTMATANAVPKNKIPGSGYHDGQIEKRVISNRTKSDCCAELSSCDKKEQPRPYWRTKVGGKHA